MDWPLQFGIFMAPFHPPGQNPTLALERDLDLIEHLDRLGFDEAWIGEHHSGGYEIIASPEVFIATAAERTKHIRLGTGVVSLPYHHPLMTAQRIVLLDHLTKGRVMLGVGPGRAAVATRSCSASIPPIQRDRMEEALDDHPAAAPHRRAGHLTSPSGSRSRTPACTSSRTPTRTPRSRWRR